jgi:hypothetical protein
MTLSHLVRGVDHAAFLARRRTRSAIPSAECKDGAW